MSMSPRFTVASAAILAMVSLGAVQAPRPSESEVAAIERACEKLVLDYAHYRDTNQGDPYGALFAEDASLVFPRAASKGRADIRADFDRQGPIPWRRHVTTNVRVVVLDADHAEGTSYVTIYGGGRPGASAGAQAPPLDGPSAVGEYHDRYVRTADGWRFVERRFTPVLVSEALARAAGTPLPPR